MNASELGKGAALYGLALLAACCLILLVGAVATADPVVETSNATIKSRDGAWLRVVFSSEGRPAVVFKPEGGVWDWRETGKLVIPVENLGGLAATLLLGSATRKTGR
jgi:hypothetical protein